MLYTGSSIQRVNLRQLFQLAACHVISRLLSCGRKSRTPIINPSSLHYEGHSSPSSRTMETSVVPGLRALQPGCSLPAMARCSCTDPPPQAIEDWGANLGLLFATILSAMPRLPTLGGCPRSHGLGFTMGPALESKGPMISRMPHAELLWENKSPCWITA